MPAYVISESQYLMSRRSKSIDSTPLLVSSAKHWDQIYTSSYHNWEVGPWKITYRYAGTYKLKPDAPDDTDVVRTLSSFCVTAFEKTLADGTIVEYEI
jgi:hypothetical protein